MANRQAAPVAIPKEAKTGLNPQPVAVLPAVDGGKYYGQIEKTFAGLASAIGEVADTAAAVEGRRAGYEAGMDPEFRPTNDFTIRARNFDASGIATFELNMKTSIATRANEIATQFPNNPAKVEEAFKQLSDEWAGTFPEAKPLAAAQIEGYRLGAVRSATRTLENQQTAARKEALSENLSARFSALDRATYGLGLDEKADATLAAQMEDLRRDLSAAQGRGDLTPAAARETLREAESTVASARILGAFDRLPSLAARQTFADDFARRYSSSEGDFAKLDPATAQKLQTAMAGRLHSEGTAVNAQSKAVAADLDDIASTATQGLTPAPATLASLRGQVALIGDPGLARTAQVLSLAELGRRQTPAELEATIGNMNKTMTEKGASAGAVALRDSAVKLLKTMRDNLGTDQLGWADRVGLVSVPPLDLGKPDLALQMRTRAQRAEAVATYYGTAPVYLMPAERDAFERAAAAGGASMLSVAKAVSEGFGERAPLVLGELGKNAPVLAHVGNLMTANGSPSFMLDVASGLQLRADAMKPKKEQDISLPDWIKKPERKDLKALFDKGFEVYGGAFALAPDAGRAAESAAQDAFGPRALRQGFDPGLSKPGSNAAYERTLQEAAGARFDPSGTQYGGVVGVGGGWFAGPRAAKVLVPPDVRADKFASVIGAIKDADLKGMAVPPQSESGAPYRARDLHNAVPVAVRGGYRFALGDPNSDEPKWIRGADGNPFVLDLAALKGTLRQRVPDAFIGGR